MKRPLKPDELRLWGVIAATVHPLPGKATPKLALPIGEGQAAPAARVRDPGDKTPIQRPAHQTHTRLAPLATLSKGEGKDPIEPNRRHRIARERDPIGARLDLHGMTYDRARGTLERFLANAWNDGWRAVLVITGKGVTGDGVLRRAAPEWLAAPHLAHIVAGISEAHRRHGGEGALYVALKRKPRI
jgi:DNA-nicking Smr family endonuclease